MRGTKNHLVRLKDFWDFEPCFANLASKFAKSCNFLPKHSIWVPKMQILTLISNLLKKLQEAYSKKVRGQRTFVQQYKINPSHVTNET
jgi:hypothetical protein